MSSRTFPLPEVVDLASAKAVAADLLRHIDTSPKPAVTATGLRQAGLPLLQILVAAKRYADGRGKPFTVKADRDGALAKLFSTYALDPILCGAPTDLVLADAAHSVKRT